MRVLFVASELTPIAKVGGLGDVAGALPKALAALGVDIRVVLPHYEVIDGEKYPTTPAGSFTVITPKGEERVTVSTTPIPGSDVPVYLLRNDEYLSRGSIYFERTAFVGSFKEIDRFLFFSRAAVTFLGQCDDWWPDIMHCQDWHTAAIPIFLRGLPLPPARYRQTKTLFTIHNLANQGKWNAEEILSALGLPAARVPSLARWHDGDISLIEQGVLNCDMLNTVSPTYAKEILTEEYGEGVEDALRERQRDCIGIVNGIDTDRFNPATDADIAARYTAATLDEKKKNKDALLHDVGLEVRDAPLFGLVSRLTHQKGIDLINAVLDRLVARGCMGVFLGMADPALEDALTDAAARHPERLYVKIGFDAVLAQKIYAGADMFLMPSRFEPCGLGQMIAMRYGTLPIVRATGGLKDTVRDGETGFVFERYDAEALLAMIDRALQVFRNPRQWREMQQSAMQHDFSWNLSAREYRKLYEKIGNTS